MSPQEDVQKLIRDTLRADAATMALVADVYDSVPPGPARWGDKEAYISFGPCDVIEDDAECITAGVQTVQIDCWSRNVGSVHCKRIVDAAKAALHELTAELADHGLVDLRVPFRRIFRDADGLTMHGVLQVEATVEEFEDVT